MRILQIVNDFKPAWETGGTARVSYEISKSLANNGHDVSILTTNRAKSINSTGHKIVDDMNVYYIDTISDYLDDNKLVVPKYIGFDVEFSEYDIIHIHEHRTMISLLAYYKAQKHGIPYVVQSHGSMPVQYGRSRLQKTFDVMFGNYIIESASGMIAQQEKEINQYRQFGVARDDIYLLPNSVNIEYIDSIRSEPEIKTVDDDQFRIFYLGRICERKGVDLLLDSFGEIKNENVKLVLAGPDAGMGEQVKNAARSHDCISYLGFVSEEEKFRQYKRCDCYILPSPESEGMPTTILESMTCFTPVLITTECNSDYVENANAGLVVDPNVQSISEGLELMMQKSKKELNEFGSNGRDIIEKRYTMAENAGEIERIYEEVIK